MFRTIAPRFGIFRRLISAEAIVRFAAGQLERYTGVRNLEEKDDEE